MTPPAFDPTLLDALRCFEIALAEHRGRLAQVRQELETMWRRNDRNFSALETTPAQAAEFPA